jgi:hypothetical protein
MMQFAGKPRRAAYVSQITRRGIYEQAGVKGAAGTFGGLV